MTSVLAMIFPPIFVWEAGRLFGSATMRETRGEVASLDWLAEVFGAAALLVLSVLIVILYIQRSE